MDPNERNRMHLTGKPNRRKASAENRPPKEEKIQIQYTPAKPFNRTRFLLHLATMVAVVFAVILGMSIFFKSHNVVVSGTDKYTEWEVKEAAGIEENDALLLLNKAKVITRIRKDLPYVGDVRVGIKLPNTVMISITELEVVYAIADNNGGWWLMDVGGRIVDATNVASAKNYTQILGVKIQNAVIGEQAIAAKEELPTEENTQTETIGAQLPAVQIPTDQMLDAAVQVISALEACGVMGTIVSVDVTDLLELTIWYENRYEVNLGDTGRLEHKIAAMKSTIKKLGEYQSGYMDVSFTTWPKEVYHRQFDTNS